jgi:hypothetical protein
MISFKTIRQCFTKFIANEKRPELKRRLVLHWAFLILTFAAFQLFARGSAALPVVSFTGHNAGRFGPHSLPGGIPVGDKVQVITAFDSSDPVFSPTISVEAVQGGTTLMLDRVPPGNPMFDPYHVYYKFIDFDPGLTGSWQITPADSTGTGQSAITPAIAQPEFLPLVADISVHGTPLGARVDWTLQNLDGFDVDRIAVRVINATSGGHVWESPALPVQTTNFVPPIGTLQAGTDYVYAIILGDWEGSDLENASWTFSEPFRFTTLAASGDFNLDGTVDAADYVVWRNGLGTIYNQTDYTTWRAHFGQTAGSRSAGYGHRGSGPGASTESLSAAVPEPASVALLLFAAACSLRTESRRWVAKNSC